MKYLLIAFACLLLLAVPCAAAEYTMPLKVGGQTLSLDTSKVDPVTLLALGGGGLGLWQWNKSRNPLNQALKKLPDLAQAVIGLWQNLSSGKQLKSADVTVNFDSGDPIQFTINLAAKKPA